MIFAIGCQKNLDEFSEMCVLERKFYLRARTYLIAPQSCEIGLNGMGSGQYF
jgi:hypothetical protein